MSAKERERVGQLRAEVCQVYPPARMAIKQPLNVYPCDTNAHTHTQQMSVSISSEVQYVTSSSQLSTRTVRVVTTGSHVLTK